MNKCMNGRQWTQRDTIIALTFAGMLCALVLAHWFYITGIDPHVNMASGIFVIAGFVTLAISIFKQSHRVALIGLCLVMGGLMIYGSSSLTQVVIEEVTK